MSCYNAVSCSLIPGGAVSLSLPPTVATQVPCTVLSLREAKAVVSSLTQTPSREVTLSTYIKQQQRRSSASGTRDWLEERAPLGRPWAAPPQTRGQGASSSGCHAPCSSAARSARPAGTVQRDGVCTSVQPEEPPVLFLPQRTALLGLC